MERKILVTGASGLVGSDLVLALQEIVGRENVIALERHEAPPSFEGIHELADVRDSEKLEALIQKYKITEVYHLAGLLSAGGEKDPDLAWDVNVGGLRNVLRLAVKYQLKVFWPSSIAVFGPTTPKEDVPQHTVLEPTTMYGVNKVSGELLCQYYFTRYGVDVRSLRYPGLLGYKAPPGDGTTEYAIHIFYGAIRDNHYVSYIDKGSVLPMMFMEDAVNGTIQLMNAPKEKISVRTSYNFSAIQFAPEDLVKEIQKANPKFTCEYQPDSRQKIANSWPKTIDDSQARKDWNWSEAYDLKKLTAIMYQKIKEKIG
ncbi:MAG: NAD-dependent epimerase [Chlamydiae bacterium CG10_big_fil_rev_8_21_14_0_10_42_34]|nr:MAG: NAD-dependent epimerase [Chlamydiae bacterium CG10_big_fil_rev_8_21_14_0_10_42_34]